VRRAKSTEERRRGGDAILCEFGAQAHLLSSLVLFLGQLALRIDEAIERVSHDARLRPICRRSSVSTIDPSCVKSSSTGLTLYSKWSARASWLLPKISGRPTRARCGLHASGFCSTVEPLSSGVASN
jgi:hypothetical protein